MGLGVLVLGRSGTGKSCSLRNFPADAISIVNVNGKPLPFRNQFKKILVTDNAQSIMQAIAKSTSKAIVIDDSQYVMANEYMRRSGEKGFSKFEEIGRGFWDLVMSIRSLPEDKIVYFLHHEDVNDFGQVSAKTQGKMIDTHICLEGMFTVVMRAIVSDGNYFFTTRNSGNDTVKTPMGMFEETLIDNDLYAVDGKIREYYGFAGLVEKAKQKNDK